MINPNCLRERHTLATFPNFPCPKCDATLVPIPKKLDTQESAESKFYQEYVDSGPEYVGGVFSLGLRCSNTNCKESVFCVGDFHLTQEEGPSGEPGYFPAIAPKFFLPTIQLFKIPKNLPDRLNKQLQDAFSLFWSNPSASGNSLRIFAEALLDFRCVKKWVTNKHGKEEAMSLHDRIVAFKRQRADLADKLLAIKWIGNSGSHLSGLKLEDMICAFRLMEHVLDELLNKTTEELQKLSSRINKRKGPVRAVSHEPD